MDPEAIMAMDDDGLIDLRDDWNEADLEPK